MAEIESARASTSSRRARAIAGIGRVLLWSGGSLWIGSRAGRVSPHAHHAIQISLALSGSLKFRSDPGGEWREYLGVLIRPHHRHQFDGCGETVAQVFVEPETVIGRALLERHAPAAMNSLPDDEVERLAAPLRAGFAANARDDQLIAASKAALAGLTEHSADSATVDPRVSRAIEYVRGRMGGPVSLAEAAEVVHLSPSRFRHLFAEQTGMAFRPYLLWARVEAAVGAAMSGESWTEAAQNWGFADSAHLSRTCRRMFGLAPTMLVSERAAAKGARRG
jgi:AraC family transcriptional regulator